MKGCALAASWLNSLLTCFFCSSAIAIMTAEVSPFFLPCRVSLLASTPGIISSVPHLPHLRAPYRGSSWAPRLNVPEILFQNALHPLVGIAAIDFRYGFDRKQPCVSGLLRNSNHLGLVPPFRVVL